MRKRGSVHSTVPGVSSLPTQARLALLAEEGHAACQAAHTVHVLASSRDTASFITEQTGR